MTAAVIVLIFLVVSNVVAFGLMAYDKRCAGAGKWRVPEKTLFLAAACFGALGGVLGMVLCHHKTRHWYFRVFFSALLAIQVLLLIAGCSVFLKNA